MKHIHFTTFSGVAERVGVLDEIKTGVVAGSEVGNFISILKLSAEHKSNENIFNRLLKG